MRFGSQEIITKLRAKYCAPSWAFFDEVKSEVGFGRQRIDGLAVAMWQSLGLQIIGFEVKVDRGDWLRELKNGGKSDGIYKYCDNWFLVVSDEAIVKDGELPPTWGMMVLKGNGFTYKVKATKLEPIPLNRAFVAEILRHSVNMPASDKERAEYQRGFLDGKNSVRPDDVKLNEYEMLKKRLETFEAVSGLKIEYWTQTRELAEAVKLFMHAPTISRYKTDLKNLLGQAQQCEAQIKRALESQERINFGQPKEKENVQTVRQQTDSGGD